MMWNPPSRAILVLGTHRSGTSMVAGFLHALGCNMGLDLLGASEDNPRGHFEDKDFLYLNDAIIGDWRNPQPFIQPDQHSRYAYLARWRNQRFGFWGAKDPRFCFTARYLIPHLEDVRIVCTHRDIDDIAESLQKRNKIVRKDALALTERYLTARQETLDEFPDIPIFHVRYDEFLHDPVGEGMLLKDFVLPIENAIGMIGLDSKREAD